MTDTVGSYEDVVTNVRAFNRGLEEAEDLEAQLSYFRAWYYVPEIDAVGASKFIGYQGMTAHDYMRSVVDLDGRVTEPILAKWFEQLGDDSPEGNYVRRLAMNVLRRYGKTLNARARFNVPVGWRLSDNAAHQGTTSSERPTSSSQGKPIVEVFWRAYLGLYPEDQQALAERVIKHSGK